MKDPDVEHLVQNLQSILEILNKTLRIMKEKDMIIVLEGCNASGLLGPFQRETFVVQWAESTEFKLKRAEQSINYLREDGRIDT